jgi:hypothetical protein
MQRKHKHESRQRPGLAKHNADFSSWVLRSLKQTGNFTPQNPPGKGFLSLMAIFRQLRWFRSAEDISFEGF